MNQIILALMIGQYNYNYQYVIPQATFVAVDYDIVGQQQRNDAREAKFDYLIKLLEKKIPNEISSPPISSPPISSPSNINSSDPPLPANFKLKQKYKDESKQEYKDEGVPPPPEPINSNISAIFKNNCVKCHSNTQKSALNLFTLNGSPVNLTPKSLIKIDFAISSGRMPKKSGPLSDKDKLTIREWITEYEDQILANLK